MERPHPRYLFRMPITVKKIIIDAQHKGIFFRDGHRAYLRFQQKKDGDMALYISTRDIFNNRITLYPSRYTLMGLLLYSLMLFPFQPKNYWFIRRDLQVSGLKKKQIEIIIKVLHQVNRVFLEKKVKLK